ncbi:MAG: hypothetical protein ACRDXE_01685 [Acidimicrobiales bacterium]
MVTLNLPNQSTCGPWAAPSDITEADMTGLSGSAETTLLLALQAASDVLFQLSGRQYSGACQDTVRPSARRISVDHGRPIVIPTMQWAGAAYWSGGFMSGGGGFSQWGWYTSNQEELPGGLLIPSVDLGAFPVTGIEQVLIDGAVVDPDTYRVDDNRHLVRLPDPDAPGWPDNNAGWPIVQRMDLPTSEPDTFEVSFDYGTPPPPIGVMAAAELGYQLYAAVTPAAAGTCRLPQRVTQITRQGITAVVLDPMTFLDKGRTGLLICDYFLESINPHSLRRRATAWSPDLGGRVVRRTGH